MAQVLSSLAPLLVTLALRQAMETAMRRDLPSSKPRAGRASIVYWSAAYLLLLAFALWRVSSTAVMGQPWWGYAVIWIGLLLRVRSLRAIGRYYDYLIVIRDDHRLIDTGPYRWLRHPLHLGLHLEMVGLALLAGAAFGWIALGLSVLALVRRNRQEERALEDFFGVAYCAYRRRTWDIIDLLPGRRPS